MEEFDRAGHLRRGFSLHNGLNRGFSTLLVGKRVSSSVGSRVQRAEIGLGDLSLTLDLDAI